jgi:hypothetical protein
MNKERWRGRKLNETKTHNMNEVTTLFEAEDHNLNNI